MQLARREVTSRDVLNLRTIEGLDLSRDGERLCWAVRKADRETNSYRSDLWASGWRTKPRRITFSDCCDEHPRWSPDGRYLAFLSDRGASDVRQVWIMPSDGGEPRRVTAADEGVVEFAWSPAGDALALVAPLNLRAQGNRGCTDLYKKYNRDTRVITRLQYRWDGRGYFDGIRNHLAVVEFFETSMNPETPEFLTEGPFDVSSPSWSPDGKSLAFSTNMHPDSDAQRRTDIYVISRDAGEAVNLTCSEGPADHPVWSPDGGTVVFVGHDRPSGDYSTDRLWAVAADGSDPRSLTAEWDHPVGDLSLGDVRGSGSQKPIFSGDGRRVYFIASVRGESQIYCLELQQSCLRAVTSGPQNISGFAVSAGRAAAIVARPLSPSCLALGEITGSQLRVAADPNEEIIREMKLSQPERFSFVTDGDVEIDAWVMRPVGCRPGEKYPTVLQIHGGPMVMYGDGFFHEFQLLTSRGFAVVYCNPRGSQGYGEDFCAAIEGDWGKLDYSDVISCVDEAVEMYGFIDPDRLGVAGGSYGGFLTNWVITHTDRFAAAVTMRSLVNRHSEFATGDIGYLSDEEMGGFPWEVPVDYLKASPIYHVDRCTTPTMIIHSDMDLRCPVEQAEQLYVCLKRLGVDTEFVRFSGESHGLSRGGKPWHRVFRLDKIIEWFEKYLTADSSK